MPRTQPQASGRPRDEQAGDFLRILRLNRTGLSPEDLAPLVRQKGIAAGYPASRVAVSPSEIRLVENGHIPGPRIKFALALFFDLTPGQIWAADSFDTQAAPFMAVRA